MKDRAIRKAPRRRRSWYRRQLRRQRIIAAAVLVTLIAAVFAVNLVRILSSSARVTRGTPGLVAARALFNQELGLTPPLAAKHPKHIGRVPAVYPYSLVPGGVRDASGLREAAANDRAVARHYAHFDFRNARLERISEPREVYVSYRIRDTIFWTRKKVHLPAGELLLTDGKIAARAKCGNQISETAKPEVSDEEPAEDVMEQPVAELEPLGPPFPMRPSVTPPDLPIGQPIKDTFSGGFSFPLVPILAGPPIGLCLDKNGKIDKNCDRHHHHKPPPGSPEPGTMVLLGSGLAIVVWRYRVRQPDLMNR